MTNLQEGALRISARNLRRIWFWLPIATGAILAAVLATTVLTPLWVSLQKDSERLREVEALRERLGQERLRAKTLDEQQEQANGQRAKLIKVISGNGDVSTFLAELDQLAKANGVQLNLYEPTAAAAGAELDTNKDGKVDEQEKQQKPQTDPLEVEGMTRHSLVMSARGRFPQLLSFLRELEALNVLVVQSDLQLNLETAQPSAAQPVPQESVLMKMALSLYSRKPAQAGSSPAAPTPGQPAANPPAKGAAAGTPAPN